MSEIKRLDIEGKNNVEYCIPLWLRDLQIQQNTARIKERVEPCHDLKDDPIAIVCFGPSLNDTWEQIKDFKYVMTCSGSHKFLVERGIIPTYHAEVDPRDHKIKLMGQPQKETEYLISATCHPKLLDHLEGYNVKIWHVFDGKEDGIRNLPANEWALMGGCSVGLRAMTIARFMGFTNQHIFGMDGCEGPTGKHAAEHPSQAKGHSVVTYNGVDYRTTAGFLESARQTFHELDQMPDVKAKFYGDGLVQAMAKDYIPKPVDEGKRLIGFAKPELISAEYRMLNEELHRTNLAYGVGGKRHVQMVLDLVATMKSPSVLDYGCGKGLLAQALPFPIWEYDPAIPGKTESPRPADLVICTDVLEHIELYHLAYVLDDLRRCVKNVGFFVIDTEKAIKTLPDGRNTHLIVKDRRWWDKHLRKFFTVASIQEKGRELFCIVGPKPKKEKHVDSNPSAVDRKNEQLEVANA